MMVLAWVGPLGAVAMDGVAGPRILFAETNLDFGRIESGQVVRHDFIFTNTGVQTLEIQDVRPSCGCTTVPEWNRRIEPGSTGAIPFQFNSEGFSGDVTKTLIVVCNDPGNTNVVLSFNGHVSKTVEMTPAQAVFARISDNPTNGVQVVRIVNYRDEPLHVWAPACASPLFEPELKTNSPGREYELQVALNTSGILSNAVSSIMLKTSAPKAPTIAVTASLMVWPAVSATPARITLPPAPLTSEFRTAVTIRNLGTNPVVLSNPFINISGTETTIREVQKGRLFIMDLSFPAGVTIQSRQQAEALVRTSHPLFPEIKIPVTQGRHLAETLARDGESAGSSDAGVTKE